MSKQIRFGEPIEPDIPVEYLPPEALLTADLGQRRRSQFQVYIVEQVYEDIWSHVKQTSGIESGGVLVGHPFKTLDEQITFVVVVAAIPQHSNNRSVGHFTVGPPEIAAARAEMEQHYPGLVAVGWYHSHPGHGIFLSGQDMTIVSSIYNLPWHIALVVDPKNRREGIFVGSQGKQIGERGNDRLRASWIGLQAVPDSVKTVALHNQRLEDQDTKRNSLTAPTQPLPTPSSVPEVSSQPTPAPPEPARGVTKTAGKWLWFSLLATLPLILFFCGVALGIPELARHPMVLASGFILSLTAVGINWYATSLGNMRSAELSSTNSWLGSQISRFGTLGLSILIVTGWCSFSFYINTLGGPSFFEILLLNPATATAPVIPTQTMTLTPSPMDIATVVPFPTNTVIVIPSPTNTPVLPTPTLTDVPTLTATLLPEPTEEVIQPTEPITAPVDLDVTEVLTQPETLTHTTTITSTNLLTDTNPQ
jgi:proteasome lid subunit RPN8/RPN11